MRAGDLLRFFDDFFLDLFFRESSSSELLDESLDEELLEEDVLVEELEPWEQVFFECFLVLQSHDLCLLLFSFWLVRFTAASPVLVSVSETLAETGVAALSLVAEMPPSTRSLDVWASIVGSLIEMEMRGEKLVNLKGHGVHELAGKCECRTATARL